MALRSKVAAKADSFAVRTSVILTRAIFVGLLLLPLLEPNSFYIMRAGRVTSPPPETELPARSEPVPAAREVRPKQTAEADHPPAPADVLSPPARTAESNVPSLPTVEAPSPASPAQPTDPAVPPITPRPPDAKPLPPSKQTAQAWTESEIAEAKAECAQILSNVTAITEPLPPAREGICGDPAPRELRSIGESKVKFDPPATLNCRMIAGLATWVTEKLQPAAQQNFGSPIVRIIGESYSCRNRYGLSRAPLSEHALMDALDVTGFVLADGKVIRVSKGWGPTAAQLKREAAKTSETLAHVEGKDGKFQVAASKLGANDLASKKDEAPKPAEADKEAAAKKAMSSFLRQAHEDACGIFGTVLGPDANAAHHDHFHLDMKERRTKRALCE
ncbi:extensin family protein [Hyphomicrobium sp.]|uniref:extensin-like domain-containing protein n=1 Tax=Hyphomicrobium sp. TaxID=82 RepID=UPI002D791580|nr:extensin family protein [Hyphomicrobium sp.]HET6390837.1 extensin family protein [Hyphomicrobium sp.]